MKQKTKEKLIHVQECERATWCTIQNKHGKTLTVGLKILQSNYHELYKQYKEKYK